MQKTGITPDYLKQRTEQLKKQREENSRYYSLKQGENTVKINLSVLPEEITQKGNDGRSYKKMVYTLENMKGDKPMLLTASLALDQLIVKALSNGINPMTIIRVGESLNTRYNIKEFSEEEEKED